MCVVVSILDNYLKTTLKMVGGVDHDELNDVDYREQRNLPRSVSAYADKLPRSVSIYDEMHTDAAHEALLNASKSLLPLADYIEENFTDGHQADGSQFVLPENGAQINKDHIN